MAAQTSSTGLGRNTAAALSYVFGPISGVIFLVLDGKDKYVKFHAMQSIVFGVAAFILNTVLGFTIVLAILVPILLIVEFVLWLMLIYKAWQGEEWEIPVVGKFARQFAAKV